MQTCAIGTLTSSRSPRIFAALRTIRGNAPSHDQSPIPGHPPAPWADASRDGGRLGLQRTHGDQQIRAGFQSAPDSGSSGAADAGIRLGTPSKGLAKKDLTQERLKYLLHYDQDAGVFTWRVDRIRVRAGERAGKIDGQGYVAIGIDGHRHAAHRLAFLYMTGVWPSSFVDHINSDRSDNSWCNLRVATNSQNQANVLRWSHNTSGFKGVSWHKSTGRWQANIRSEGGKKSLGYFDTPEAAYEAYCTAAFALHGEFARIT